MKSETARDLEAIMRESIALQEVSADQRLETGSAAEAAAAIPSSSAPVALPPLNSAEKFTREVPVESLTNDIRPLGQLDESFIIAVDNDGLLLIDQHVAHERILFDKYRALESTRSAESQHAPGCLHARSRFIRCCNPGVLAFLCVPLFYRRRKDSEWDCWASSGPSSSASSWARSRDS